MDVVIWKAGTDAQGLSITPEAMAEAIKGVESLPVSMGFDERHPPIGSVSNLRVIDGVLVGNFNHTDDDVEFYGDAWQLRPGFEVPLDPAKPPRLYTVAITNQPLPLPEPE